MKAGDLVFLRAMSNERSPRPLPYGWFIRVNEITDTHVRGITTIYRTNFDPIELEFLRLPNDVFHYGGQEYRLERVVQ